MEIPDILYVYSMKLISAIILLILVACTNKRSLNIEVSDSYTSKGFQLKTTFYVYNQFDSLCIHVFEKDSAHQLFQIGNDTFPNNPFEKTNYRCIRNINSDKTITITNTNLIDKINWFENLDYPLCLILISELVINQFRNFDAAEFSIDKSSRIQLTHSEFGTIDSVVFMEDDFDNDGKNEICLTLFHLTGSHDFPGKTLFLEKLTNGFQLMQKEDVTGHHHETKAPIYFKGSRLFLFQYEAWGSCLEVDWKIVKKYKNGILINGPLVPEFEWSCVNEEEERPLKYFYFNKIQSIMEPITLNQFNITTDYHLMGRNMEKDEKDISIHSEQIKISYSFNDSSLRFDILSYQDTSILNSSNFFGEGNKFLLLVKENINYLKKNGTEKQKEMLLEFDYFSD